jgi:hypothetical protein
MGLFSFVGSLLGGSSAKKASKKAQQAQIDALNNAVAEQRRQFDVTDANFKPYRDEGTSALGGLGDLVGTNGAPQQKSAIDALKASPFYQSLFRTGEENVLQTASATGGVRGGNTVGSLADFGADTLMKTIQQQLANLGGIAGLGLGATNSTAGFGQQTSNNVANLMTQQGTVNADGILTRARLDSSLFGNLGGFLDNAVKSFLPGGGGLKSAIGF